MKGSTPLSRSQAWTDTLSPFTSLKDRKAEFGASWIAHGDASALVSLIDFHLDEDTLPPVREFINEALNEVITAASVGKNTTKHNASVTLASRNRKLERWNAVMLGIEAGHTQSEAAAEAESLLKPTSASAKDSTILKDFKHVQSALNGVGGKFAKLQLVRLKL